eukprot:6453990-Prymnesium_polylepis.3
MTNEQEPPGPGVAESTPEIVSGATDSPIACADVSSLSPPSRLLCHDGLVKCIAEVGDCGIASKNEQVSRGGWQWWRRRWEWIGRLRCGRRWLRLGNQLHVGRPMLHGPALHSEIFVEQSGAISRAHRCVAQEGLSSKLIPDEHFEGVVEETATIPWSRDCHWLHDALVVVAVEGGHLDPELVELTWVLNSSATWSTEALVIALQQHLFELLQEQWPLLMKHRPHD